MNKSAIFFVFSCVVAVALACDNCPPPQDPISPCGAPDCTLPQNQQNTALFPHPDPNYFYQCYPHSIQDGWQPIVRQCACGTVFNPFVYPRRCTFWWESTWSPVCDWQSPPVLAPCPTWCPDCEGGNGSTTTTPIIPEDPIDTTTNENPCVCPPPEGCIPCVWWPCVPCVPAPCLCANNNQSNNNRNNPNNWLG